MICVEVFTSDQTGVADPVATMKHSGRGNSVDVKSINDDIKTELTALLDDWLSMGKGVRVSPDDRKLWMEALPQALLSIPYWFRIVDEISDIIEEEVNGDEEIDELEDEPDDTEDGTDDGGDDSADDDGGDDDSDSGTAGFTING